MGRKTLLSEGQGEPALHGNRQQPRGGEDHVNTAASPTQAETLAMKVGWMRAATSSQDGQGELLAGNLWHCKAPILSPKLAGLPLAEEHKASAQDEELPASGDEQGMNREPWPPNAQSSPNRNSLYSLQTHPATTALKPPHEFKEEAGLDPTSTKIVLAPLPKLHWCLYFVLVGSDGVAAALQLKSTCPVISAPCKQLC